MKVKMLTVSAGPKGVLRVGDIVEVSDSEGKLLVGGKCAEEVKPKVEIKAEPKEIKVEPKSEPKLEPKAEVKTEPKEVKKATKKV